MDVVQERITTVEDGPDTVNERLSPGGPGPEGQADTAHERLSGSANEPAEDDKGEEKDDAGDSAEKSDPKPKAAAKKTAKKS